MLFRSMKNLPYCVSTQFTVEPFAEFRTQTLEKFSAARSEIFAYVWIQLGPDVCKTFRAKVSVVGERLHKMLEIEIFL